MKTALSFLLILVCASPLYAAPAAEHVHPLHPASPEFERMKSLVGTWKGTGQTGAEKPTDAAVEYKLTSGGTALVETLFPGTPNEMVSVYHDGPDGKLTMTHYCMMGNQPKLDLVSTGENKLSFKSSPASGIPESEDQMDALDLSFSGDALTQTWQGRKGGKLSDPTVISVKKAS
ncbi:MAG TPA: hypothetical protein VL688_11440 [Verrucomicrobiae bacterium]|jgi:hypothetical protein|nr:hypothetical protein [Verrucomicrobiae bacterium]